MNMKFEHKTDAGRSAFSLAEVMFAVGIISVVFVSLYAAITQGFAVIQTARENLRATQIMQEQPWGYQASFYPVGGANQGVTYSGNIIITNAPVAGGYAGDVRLAIVSLNWQGGNVRRQRELRTLVSHYGLHNYFLQP